MTKCKDCKYGEINFWSYQECWKFDQEIDMDRTNHTAIREKHAMEFNHSGNCEFFEKYGLIQKMKDFSGNVLYSIIKLLKI